MRLGSLHQAECLLFDYGGTLDADGIAWKDQFRAIYAQLGLSLTGPEFDRRFYEADDPLIGTMAADAGLTETVTRLVSNLEDGWGKDARRGQLVVERFLASTEAALERSRALLDTLCSRYRLGLVSNWYGNLAAVCDELGLGTLFGAIADSQVVGVSKPDPALFHSAIDHLKSSPARTVMIGDSLHRDGEGARRAGCSFIWLAPPTSLPHPSVRHQISRLDQLVAALA